MMSSSNDPKPLTIVGLTGGIASGKTSLREHIVSKFGDKVIAIDADKLGHSVYTRGTPAFLSIIDTFGDRLLDDNGEINRRVLGPIVFADPHEVGTSCQHRLMMSFPISIV